MQPSSARPVVVIGAGPVGLAAAAHLAERGLPAVVFEAGAAVAAGVASWAHVQLFSPWSYLVDPAARRLLRSVGWAAPPPEEYPTGAQWRERYLLPLADVLSPAIQTDHRVLAVTRRGHDLMMDDQRSLVPYVVTVAGPDGVRRVEASAVIDASGTLATPSPLGADGVLAQGEVQARASGVLRSTIPHGSGEGDWAGIHTAVVGSGHSAMTALIGLAEVARRDPATTISWVLRRPLTPARLGGGSADQLQRRGALGQAVGRAVDEGLITVIAPFRTTAIVATSDGYRLEAQDGRRLEGLDRVVSLTGYRPDLTLEAEVRLDLDPSVQAPRRLAPLIDPNVHSCGSVPPHGVAELSHPDEGFYLVGMKSYGRAPTFLALTGYEQVRSIVAAIAGDDAAAQRIELQLPETGVCGGTGLAGGQPPEDTTGPHGGVSAAQQVISAVPAEGELALVGEGNGCC